MFKKSKLFCFVLGIFLTISPFINCGSFVYAAEQNQLAVQEYNETVATYKKVIDEQLKKMETMTKEEKINEVNRLLSEHEGETITLFNPSDNFSRATRAAAKTEVKIVNGGMNYFAYNKEGINKLANLFGGIAGGDGAAGGSAGIAAIIAGALGIATWLTAGLAALIAALGGFVATRFGTAREMLRTHEYLGHSKAGTRITVTETLDITNMGINAYG